MLKQPLPSIKNIIEFCKEFTDEKTLQQLKVIHAYTKEALENNKTFIIQGGFAVDLLAGRVTRQHNDIDCIILESDIQFFKNSFTQDGYRIKHHQEMNSDLTFVAKKYNAEKQISIHIDFGSIRIINNTVSDSEDNISYWTWPVSAEDLIWTRIIDDLPISFLNPFIVYSFKKVKKSRDKEEHDYKIMKNVIPSIYSLLD